MKKFKKLNAVITATLMAAALSVPMASSLSVSAATGDNSITVNAGNDKMTHSAVAAICRYIQRGRLKLDYYRLG